jgi:hypothetical protein
MILARYEVIAWDGCAKWIVRHCRTRKVARQMKRARMNMTIAWLDTYPIRIVWAKIKIWDRQHGENGGFIR